MRFVLSALLATALLGTLVTADVHHVQQTAFRLETRQAHEQKDESVNNLQRQKASSLKERRNLQHQAALDVPAAPITECQTEHCKRDYHHRKAVENEDTELAFHRKISRNRKTRELGQKKKKVVKRSSGKKSIGKKVMKNEDTELAFHRKISRNRKTRALGQKKKKVVKRSSGKKSCGKKSSGKKSSGKKVMENEDTEFAFHRKISRSRKTRELGLKKGK
ncbi:hypothetical protein EC968_003181 [Mortierella alpina]|nr:hypothetical protein EC968_003181 [Mortierella alpina]